MRLSVYYHTISIYKLLLLFFRVLLFTVRLGSTSLNSNSVNVLRLSTDIYALHPDYNPDTLENDIGLIQFRQPITLTGI